MELSGTVFLHISCTSFQEVAAIKDVYGIRCTFPAVPGESIPNQG